MTDEEHVELSWRGQTYVLNNASHGGDVIVGHYIAYLSPFQFLSRIESFSVLHGGTAIWENKGIGDYQVYDESLALRALKQLRVVQILDDLAEAGG